MPSASQSGYYAMDANPLLSQKKFFGTGPRVEPDFFMVNLRGVSFVPTQLASCHRLRPSSRGPAMKAVLIVFAVAVLGALTQPRSPRSEERRVGNGFSRASRAPQRS